MVASSATPSTRIVIPFLNTRPLTDLCWTLVLLPVWWVLGAEQFAPAVLVLLAGLKLLLVRDRVSIPPVLVWLALFIAAQLVSALFIVEPFRFVSFLRTLIQYLMAFTTVFILVNTLTSKRSVLRVLTALVACLALSSLAGLAGIVGVARPEFSSLVGELLPQALAATDYGQQILYRQIGAESWFRGLGQYFRVDGFFLFSTTYAAALAMGLPVALWLTAASSGSRRTWVSIATCLLAVNLVFTTGRGAILGLAIAAVYPLMLGRRLHIKVMLLTAGLGLLVLAAAVVPGEAIDEGVRSTLFARGEGSAVSRLTIYSHSLNGFLERPLFGWGTERDIQMLDFAYPAGSHSDVLGTLYKHGSVGFLLYVCLWLSIWRSGRPVDGSSRSQASLANHLRWSLLAAAAISFITVISLDSMLMLVFWVIVGVTVALPRLPQRTAVSRNQVAA